jgi:hypothetical protein
MTAGEQMFAKVVAITGANGELIIDVSELGRGSGQFQFCLQMAFAKELAITIRVCAAGLLSIECLRINIVQRLEPNCVCSVYVRA